MRPRRLVYALLAVFILAAIVTKVYLISRRASLQVATHLQSAFGVPVQVTEADIGFSGGSRLQNVQVFEPVPPKTSVHERRPAEPWFRVDHAEADVSALGLLAGSSMPSSVHLSGVSITLRFDKDANLLTRLPSFQPAKGILPEIVIESGKLTLKQEDHDPMVIEGIHGKLMPDAGKLKASGTIADPFWGQWAIGGNIDLSLGSVLLTLDDAKAAVTAQKLKKLPFVPPVVWKQVMAEGTTPVRLTLGFSFVQTNSFHYKVELAPIETRVRVSSIDLDATRASGKVIVEDHLVTLVDVHGCTGDGTIAVDGTLDFRPTPSVLKLNVSIRDVTLHSLPHSWEIPALLDGKLTGGAKLRLVLSEPAIQTEGSTGEGIVKDMTLFGLGVPVRGTTRLYLRAELGRFSFSQKP